MTASTPWRESQDRILRNVVIHPRSRCWHWIAARDRDGYGVTRNLGSRRTQRAHRVAYEAFNGPLSPDLLVLHECDRPSCVNPEHLRAGTHVDNVHDCKNKGRLADTRGECHGLSKLTEEKVRAIRQWTGTQSEAARHFGVRQQAISKIVRGLRWSHVR